MAIKSHEGNITNEERGMIDLFRHHANEYPIPDPLDSYLRSIGDFRDGSNALYHSSFDMYDLDDEGGFGVIDQNNHYRYESFPTPFFVLRRVIEGYLYKLNPNRDRLWDIRDLSPDEDNCGRPTVNLLGCAPSQQLNLEQRGVLEQIRIIGEELPIRVQRYGFCQSLKDKLASFMRDSVTSMKMGAELHDSRNGSVGQQVYLMRDILAVEGFSRLNHYADGISYNAGTFALDGRIDLISMVLSM